MFWVMVPSVGFLWVMTYFILQPRWWEHLSFNPLYLHFVSQLAGQKFALNLWDLTEEEQNTTPRFCINDLTTQPKSSMILKHIKITFIMCLITALKSYEENQDCLNLLLHKCMQKASQNNRSAYLCAYIHTDM